MSDETVLSFMVHYYKFGLYMVPLALIGTAVWFVMMAIKQSSDRNPKNPLDI